jgi:hypothetical protein
VTQIKLRRIFIRRAPAALAIAAQEPQARRTAHELFYNVPPPAQKPAAKSSRKEGCSISDAVAAGKQGIAT